MTPIMAIPPKITNWPSAELRLHTGAGEKKLCNPISGFGTFF